MNTQQISRKKSTKEVKVLAINTLYQHAEDIFNYEYDFFSKLIGIDPFKVDGSLKQKYEHERKYVKDQLQDGTFVNVSYWFTSRYNSLDVTVKLCVHGGSYDDKPATYFCQYEQVTLQILKTDEYGKLLETVPNVDYLKKRYNLSDLTAIAENIEQAKKAYEIAANKMPYVFNEVFNISRLTN